MDEMVSGAVQKVGEVKPCPPNPVHLGPNRAGFLQKTYKKVGFLRRKSPEIALAVLFDSDWRRSRLSVLIRPG
jgi:hypothetical protein